MINVNNIKQFVEKLCGNLYPGCYSDIVYDTSKIKNDLEKMFEKLDIPLCEVEKYIEKLPNIKEKLNMDVEAFYNSDPAAKSKDEIIMTYPGFYAIMIYRLAHELQNEKIPLIPRLMSEIAHSKTGIDIHPGAVIGDYFFIDHGTGIVIGETAIIGNNVRMYQGVTIGALSLENARKLVNIKRHPTICDNVVIYAGASILGGQTIIGNNVIIGSNVFITKSVKDNVLVKLDNKNYKIIEITKKT